MSDFQSVGDIIAAATGGAKNVPHPHVQYLSTAQVAEITGLRQDTVRHWIYRGKVKGVRFASVWMISKEELEGKGLL